MFEINYSATIAQEYAKFWVGIESLPIRIVQRGSVVTPRGPTISTTRRPIMPTSAVFVPDTELAVHIIAIQKQLNFFLILTISATKNRSNLQ